MNYLRKMRKLALIVFVFSAGLVAGGNKEIYRDADRSVIRESDRAARILAGELKYVERRGMDPNVAMI